MELTTSWKEEGIEIGKQQGIEIGREQGREKECQVVLRQLRKRLGAVEPEWEARIRRFSFEKLGELGEALVDFGSRQDLAGWMAAHGQ